MEIATEPRHCSQHGSALRRCKPGLAPGEVDLLRAQETPDILHIDIASAAANSGPDQRA